MNITEQLRRRAKRRKRKNIGRDLDRTKGKRTRVGGGKKRSEGVNRGGYGGGGGQNDDK